MLGVGGAYALHRDDGKTGGASGGQQPAHVLLTVSPKGDVTISGRVPKGSDEDALVKAAKALAGKGGKVDQTALSVGSGPAPWAPGLAQAIDTMVAEKARVTRLAADGASTATVTAEVRVPTAKARKNVLAALAKVGTKPKVTATVTVAGTGGAKAVQADLDAALRGKVVEFDTGSTTLTKRGRATLDAIVPILRTSTLTVRIAGYTDAQGDAKANQRLSQRRADAVKAYLVARKVPAKRLVAQGFGEARPVASNATEKGRAKNRRIEFVVVKRK